MINARISRKKWFFAAGLGIFLAASALGTAVYLKFVYFNLPFPPSPAGAVFEELLPQDVSFVVSINPTDSEQAEKFKNLLDVFLLEKKDVFLPAIIQELIRSGSYGSLTNEEILSIAPDETRFVAGFGPKNIFYLLFPAKNPEAARNLLGRIKPKSGEPRFGVTGDVAYITNGKLAASEKESLMHSKTFRFLGRYFKKPASGYAFTEKNAASLRAAEDGIFMDTVFAGEKRNFYAPSLYKEIPGQQLIAFIESQNLANFILSNVKEDFLAQMKGSTGFDFNQDIAPFLKKGFAFSIADSGELLPNLSLYIDAGGAKEKALDVIKKLDENIPVWTALMNASLQTSDEKPFAESKKLAVNSQGSTVKLYFDRIPKEISDTDFFGQLKKPVEISYGIIQSDLLFVSTTPDFENVFAQKNTVENQALFSSFSKLGVHDSEIVLADGPAVLKFISRVFDFARTQKKLSDEEDRLFGVFNKYLSHIGKFAGAKDRAFVEIIR